MSNYRLERDDLISVSEGMCVGEFSTDDLAKAFDRKYQQLTHIRQNILSHDADEGRLTLLPPL